MLPIALAAALAVLALIYVGPWLALLPLVAAVFLYLLFRDPERHVPPVALGIVSPVDGEVVEIDTTDQCVVQGEAHRVRIRINALGSYTARSPIEGRVMDLRSRIEEMGAECPTNALWVETDEGDSVVLQFHDYRMGLAPEVFRQVGRAGRPGQRCAYIRLARSPRYTCRWTAGSRSKSGKRSSQAAMSLVRCPTLSGKLARMIHPEQQRRAYLQAMGIDVWLPRDAEEPEAAASVTSAEGMDWPELRDCVAACTRCELSTSRTNTVFGVGNTDADWLIIGEAPGAEEDRRGEPFVGRAGQLLDQMLLAIGQSRESVFIANILKCRPPNNRDPKPTKRPPAASTWNGRSN